MEFELQSNGLYCTNLWDNAVSSASSSGVLKDSDVLDIQISSLQQAYERRLAVNCKLPAGTGLKPYRGEEGMKERNAGNRSDDHR
jgi:hypothetical protein